VSSYELHTLRIDDYTGLVICLFPPIGDIIRPILELDLSIAPP